MNDEIVLLCMPRQEEGFGRCGWVLVTDRQTDSVLFFIEKAHQIV
jgi:hypothetical protein